MRDEFAGNLSGGQRKLLEMARALMADPKLIMLDEPMAGVNPALKQSLLGHIKELRDEGRTVLFVEHDMDMVHEISDWVLVMAQGQLIAEGTAEQISGTQAVIDAYLGAHHDVDLGAMTDEQAVEELGLAPGPGRSRPSPRVQRSRADVDVAGRRSDADDVATDRRRGERMTDGRTSSKPATLVAGYVPEVNILNGCDLYVAPGEFVGIIGPERCRQVDAAEGDARPRVDPVRFGAAARRRDHRPATRTSWCSAASGSCRRRTTCSRR